MLSSFVHPRSYREEGSEYKAKLLLQHNKDRASSLSIPAMLHKAQLHIYMILTDSCHYKFSTNYGLSADVPAPSE
jgi:hypothetical protein